jgi:hypothetical protein
LAKFTLAFAWVILTAMGLFARWQGSAIASLLIGFAAATGYLILMAGLYVEIGGWDAVRPLAYLTTYPRLFAVSLLVGGIGLISAMLLRRGSTAGPPPALILGLVLFLHIPTLFLDDGAGGSYYWFNAADHTASAVCLATLLVLLDRGASMGARRMLLAATTTVSFVFVGLTVPGFIPAANTLATTLTAIERLGVTQTAQTRTATAYGHEVARQLLAPERPEPWSKSDFVALGISARVIAGVLSDGLSRGVGPAIASTPLYRAASELKTLVPGRVASRPAVFVRPESNWYWGAADCMAGAFAIQALTGIAQLLGVPPTARCPPTSGYGMAHYGADSQNRALPPSALCFAAEERRLAPVFVVDELGHVTAICSSALTR